MPLAPSSPDFEHYTVAQVAEWLGLSERTIRRYIKERALPVRHFGREIRIRRDDFLAWYQWFTAQKSNPQKRG